MEKQPSHVAIRFQQTEQTWRNGDQSFEAILLCIEAGAGKTEATQIVPSRLQAGKGMIAHRIEGMFSHEGGNPYSFQDSLLKIAIIH